MSNSEPPYLPIGTEVSAKYKGAFCEAKVKKVDKSVKCKVFVKETQSNLLVTDEYLTGPLKMGAAVEVKHPDTGRIMEAVVKHMSDSSMYTVVFDDADERTLRRTQLCLKGDKHFMESETLDNLPLSHPEHFGTPVINKKRAKASQGNSNQDESEESSEEEVEASPRRQLYKGKAQELVGKVMFLEAGDRKRAQQLPVLVVLPDAHPATTLKTKDHVLTRSFKDSKFFPAARKDLVHMTREMVLKNEDKSLKPAMEKALLFVDNRELPLSWNKEELLGSEDEEPEEVDEWSDDEEPSEDKDRFIAQLIKFCDDRGTPMNKGPSIGNKDLNLYKLFRIVQKLGGYNRVTNQMKWRLVYSKMGLPPSNTASTQIKNAYKKYLHAFEDFYRKLGSSMGTISRPGRQRNDSGRSLLSFRGRDRDTGRTPEKTDSDKEKLSEDTRSEAESDLEAATPKQGTPKRAKSARVRLELKDIKEEKKEELKEKPEPKKDEKETKETKKETKAAEKAAKKAEKAEEKKEKETKVEPEKPEKKTTKKKDKEETPAKTKKEIEEEKDLKDLQKKIGRRRSMRNDEKAEEEEEEKKDKKEEKEEEKKKEAPEKVPPKKEAPEKVLTRKEAPEKVSLKKDVPEKVLPKKDVPEKVSLKKEAPEKGSVKKEAQEKTPSKKEPPEKVLPKKEAPEKVTPKKEVPEKVSVKKEVPEKVSLKKEALEKGSVKKEAPEKVLKKEGPEKPEKPVEKRVKKKKTTPVKGEEMEDEEEKQTVSPLSTTGLPVNSKLKVRYGRGKNTREYEAKILEVGADSGPKQYLVHYLGWNNRHDEWVKPERIVKVLERPDSKKKQKPSPRPGSKPVLKKKALISDKPPASPSSVKSDSSVGQSSSSGGGRATAKGSRTPPASSPASVSSKESVTAPAPKPRPTRSNSIEVKTDGLPAKRRTPKTSAASMTTTGSDSEASEEKSFSDSEEEKKKEKVKTTDSAKSVTMPTIVVKKTQEEDRDVESNIERSPPQLSKVTDIGKDKMEVDEKLNDSAERSEEVKEEPVAPILKVMDIEKSEPILQKMEAQIGVRVPIAKVTVPEEASSEKKEEKEAKKKEAPEKEVVKRKEPEKRIRKPPLKFEDMIEIPAKLEKLKVDKDKEKEKEKEKEKVVEPPVKNGEVKKEDVLYEFKDDSDDEVKLFDKKKQPVVALQEIKVKVEKEPPKKDASVSISVNKFIAKNASQEDLDQDKELVKDVPFTDEKECAKSDSEVEKRASRKKRIVQEEIREVKKAKLTPVEKKSVEISSVAQANTISASPEQKPFVTLAAKKQGFSPIVRKVPSVSVQRNPEPSECAIINIPKLEIEVCKADKKEETKKGLEMVVIHKESPVKHDILVGKKPESAEKDSEESEKKIKEEDEEPEEKEEAKNETQNVKKKVRKKTKKKIDMDEAEPTYVPRKTKTRGFSAKVRDSIKDNKEDEVTEEKITEETNLVNDSMEIDLHCEEEINSRTASPEPLMVNDRPLPISDSQGLDMLTEVMEGLQKDSMQSSSGIALKHEQIHKPDVFENTPPTTPEHDTDDATHNSGQCEQIKTSVKGFSDSEVNSKVDTAQKIGSESPEGNASPSNHSTSSSGAVGGSEGSVDVPVVSTKRRRVSDETTPSKRRKRASRGKSTSSRARQLAESDSEDACSMSAKGRSPHYSSDGYPSRTSASAHHARSPNRPSKYNFNLEEGQYLEGTARISFLVDKIQEIRKIYMGLKSEVACIDRRRKRLKKREREGTSNSAAEGDFS